MTLTVPTTEPRPAHLTADLLTGVEGVIRRYVVIQDPNATTALALYVLHTWAFEAAHTTPYVILSSAEKQSGKTLLLEVLELLVRAPWRTATTSSAALFRRVHRDHPTLLLDEIDATFTGKGDTESLRGVLNAGNRRGGQATRFDGKSEDVRDFDVFCPKVLAGIDTGHVPETVRDRSIIIRMHRRRNDEPVERFRFRRAVEDTAGLRDRLQAWADDFCAGLSDADPELPDVLGHRAAEGWEPLLAIADLASGDWPECARSAACALSGATEDGEEVGRGAQLLAAIQRLMDDRKGVATDELLASLNSDELLPFGGWNDGSGLDARALARLLRPYGIKPGKHRLDSDPVRGYLRSAFSDAWDRYL